LETTVSGIAFWTIQLPGWLLFAYLLVAQCTAAISYSLGVKMGTQEPAQRVTEIGVAFWKGYAGADLVFYTPLLGIALVGHFLRTSWADLSLAAALGVTVYWPIACLWTVKAARGAKGWDLPKEAQYWVVLPIIASWGAVGLILLLLGF
tara:strand:- start:106 stop:552 length:447 start_codon:yes stop_codon:yes gene_type:complete